MEAMVLPAETLNLPERFANLFRGKKVEITEKQGSVLITPIEFDAINTPNDRHAVSSFIEQKQIEKELENQNDERLMAMRKKQGV